MNLEREIHPSSTSFPRVLQGLMLKRNPSLRMRRMVLGPARKWSRIQWTVSRNFQKIFHSYFVFLEAKALAEKAMSDPMGAATQSLDKIKFW